MREAVTGFPQCQTRINFRQIGGALSFSGKFFAIFGNNPTARAHIRASMSAEGEAGRVWSRGLGWLSGIRQNRTRTAMVSNAAHDGGLRGIRAVQSRVATHGAPASLGRNSPRASRGQARPGGHLAVGAQCSWAGQCMSDGVCTFSCSDWRPDGVLQHARRSTPGRT